MTMRRLAGIAVVACLLLALMLAAGIRRGAGTDSEAITLREPAGEEDADSPETQRAYLERLHDPYGAALPQEFVRDLWDDIQRLPSEREMEGPAKAAGWQCIGPFGANANYLRSAGAAGRYTGRVLDLGSVSGVGLRFAAASGGLWSPAVLGWYPISDQITSLAVSSFDTKPGGPNTIVLGTGEYYAPSTGTGFWKTVDGGVNWTHAQAYPEPHQVIRVRFDPQVPDLVHAVADNGYYQSTDGGDHWYPHWYGLCTDIAFAVNGTQRLIYIATYDNGLYRSEDDGLNWQRVTAASGVPAAGNGRTLLGSAFVPASQQSVIYAAMSRSDRDTLLGVFRSTNAGYDWAPVQGQFPFRVDSYGGYAAAMAVCPTNPDLVLLGWIKSYRTADGGRSWQLIDNLQADNHDNTHDDWHQFLWTTGGFVYGASDGGIFFSQDYGVTWQPSANNVPITQFYTVAVGGPGHNVIFGGAQDNGIMRSTDGGASWLNVQPGDGQGVAILPVDQQSHSNVAAMTGSLPGEAQRYLTADYGGSWIEIDQSLAVNGIMRSDPEGVLYTCDAGTVYSSDDDGAHWSAANPVPFQSAVTSLTVGARDPFLGRTIYATLASQGTTTGQRLMVMSGPGWLERSAGLPAGPSIWKVAPHPTDPAAAYAIFAGLGSPSGKIFFTADRGVSWTNITFGLPNVAVTDLVAHPSAHEVFVVGTEAGCFKTFDFGLHWYTWNYGAPRANNISELTYIDDRSSTGTFTVVAATYGRSIWKRDFGTADPGTTKLVQRIHRPIDDFTTVVDTLRVQGLGGGAVMRATVSLDALLHQRDRDLVIVLAHEGVRDTLAYRSGAEGQDFLLTYLDDDSPVALGDGHAPFSGPFRPYRPLGQFNGVPAEGDWYLEVSDLGAGATGALDGWSLSLDYRGASGVEVATPSPTSFALAQNHPNPFNPVTQIDFEVPRAAHVRLEIFDAQGRRVATLVDDEVSAGRHAATWNAIGRASGIYFARLEGPGIHETRKMTLLK